MSKNIKLTKTQKIVAEKVAAGALTLTARRLSALKLLKRLKATSAADALTAATVADKSKEEFTAAQVKDIFYKDGLLAAHGYVKVTKDDESGTLAYYLTAKGLKADAPAAEKTTPAKKVSKPKAEKVAPATAAEQIVAEQPAVTIPGLGKCGKAKK